MDSIREYIIDKKLPKEKEEARKIKSRSSRYFMIDGVLYRRGFKLPYLLYVGEKEADYILKDIIGRHYIKILQRLYSLVQDVNTTVTFQDNRLNTS